MALSALGWVHTNIVELNPIHSNQTQSHWVCTPSESSPIKSMRVQVGFWYCLNGAQAKNATVKENVNMLVFTRLCGVGGGVIRDGTYGCTR
jgi:hypothetical protein